MIPLGRPYSVPNLGVGGGRGDGRASPQIGRREARRHKGLQNWALGEILLWWRAAGGVDKPRWGVVLARGATSRTADFQISCGPVTCWGSLPAPTDSISAPHSTAGFWVLIGLGFGRAGVLVCCRASVLLIALFIKADLRGPGGSFWGNLLQASRVDLIEARHEQAAKGKSSEVHVQKQNQTKK